MKKELLMLFLATFVFAFQIMAQEMSISGKVTSSEDGLPIPGATIKVKGSTTATQTNSDGTYSIKAKQGDVLQFVYLGRTTIEQTVGKSTTINAALVGDNKNLNEVVVVGYGTQRKGNLTGAVTTIDIKKTLESRPIADVGRALQGAAPGLTIITPSGEVGSDPIIKIRGQIGSFQGGSAPLILLDNVEIPSIQLVNPSDIASITLLKDAAAASIYGAKAAFGVVLITSKQGSGTEKAQISYTNNFSYQNPWKDLKMGDISALTYTVDAAERIGKVTPEGAFYGVDRASLNKAIAWKEKYGSTIGADDPTVFGRDWYVQNGTKMGIRTYDPYESMVKEWAPTMTHNLSVGGTTGKTNYNLGLAFLDQAGMMKASKSDQFTRYNASLRVSSELNKYVTVRGSSIYSRRNKEYAYVTGPTGADPWLYMYRWASIYPFGNDENGDPIRSPASEGNAANTANILQNYMNINLGSTVNIMNNWKVDFDYTYTNQESINKRPGTRFTARNSWVAPKLRLDGSGSQVYVNSEGQVVAAGTPDAMAAYDLAYETYTALGAAPDNFYRSAENYNSHTINAFTTYNLKLKENHDFKFILGLNRVALNIESQFTQITNLTDINNPQFAFGVGTTTGGGDRSQEAQLGYFGRINYAYKNKYLFEANLRYDGSSKFPMALWYRWFPSFSAGWVASEESFMDWAKPALSSLKFRGSYGSIGDQTVPSGLYISQLTPIISTWIGGGNSRVNYASTPTAVSAFIKWQDIVTKNLGVDVGFLNNSLNATFEVYQRNTNNAIVPAEGIPLTFGVGAPLSNYGSLKTTGVELSVNYNHKFENGLGINLTANISNSKSIITAYGSATGVNSNYVGKKIGEIWGYRTDRLYQMDDFELDGAGKPILITLTAAESKLAAGKQAYKLKTVNGVKPVYQPFVQTSANFRYGPGDVKFIDVNGDGEISNGSNTLADHGDLEVIGNSNPKYEYGFRLGADFKGFDISAFFQGVGKREIWGDGFLAIPGYQSSDGAIPAAISENYWTPTHTDAFYPAAYNNAGSNVNNNMQIQDRYLLNMAYLRLKNLTVGYTIPQRFVKKVGISSLRVYTSLENILTWDHLGDLPIDPEAISGVGFFNNTYNLSRTGTGIPTFKSVSFGVQLNF
ncbi:SusC/RagA family TonB-linked outer membrane protein [Pedobacter sp. LMG 31464]|uniref:SusC/RagA family TonB-linked outer membrane protein n=1 Tax=Pedobacter planticolens TaxID=2679964 RepID=A0A923DZP8_9SPHI|nr:SusC/RagA family TonB-linked outer membrane protein [Pedobacter planticolens]MBB2146036.1 SusC/RagA family TonB-linked outer membrane protein [Pedobacter planticolens]